MALPTLEQYLRSSATWKGEHRGIAYSINHHAVSAYEPTGIWCMYLHLLEEQFVNPDDFAKFDREPELREVAGSYREHYPYEDVPDYGFHGGVTWYSRDVHPNRKTGEPTKALKIGCDYNHLWDQEDGYWQGLDAIERDARDLIDKLVAAVPFKERCGYCGVYDLPDQFYTARNGQRVHRSQQTKLAESGWEAWLPADQVSA